MFSVILLFLVLIRTQGFLFTSPRYSQRRQKLQGNQLVFVKDSLSKYDSIVSKLLEHKPSKLVVTDVSSEHAGHAGVAAGSKETHFHIAIEMEKFRGLTLAQRHKAVYYILDYEMKNGVHALSINATVPDERPNFTAIYTKINEVCKPTKLLMKDCSVSNPDKQFAILIVAECFAGMEDRQKWLISFFNDDFRKHQLLDLYVKAYTPAEAEFQPLSILRLETDFFAREKGDKLPEEYLQEANFGQF